MFETFEVGGNGTDLYISYGAKIDRKDPSYGSGKVCKP